MQRARDGFTIVELIITLVVMVILTGLSVVIVGNIQNQARDNERQQDVEAIARGLEQYYKQGNPKVTSTPGNIMKGTYPGLNVMLHMEGWDFNNSAAVCSALSPCDNTNTPYILEALSGVTEENLKGPSSEDEGFKSTWLMSASDETTALNSGAYLYDAFNRNNERCYGDPNDFPCTSFTIRYKKETGSQEIITVKSRHMQ